MLWFANTPSLSAHYLNNKSIGGGWIDSLEAELSKISSIQLAISFNLDHNVKPFTINRTKYFPIYIPSPKGKIKMLISRWRKSIKSENNIRPFLDVINNFKPDVIHIFGTEGAFGLITSKIDIPCVIHIQGNLTICNQKWYSGMTAVDILKYSKKWDLIKGFGLYHKYFLSKKRAAREREIFRHCKYFMGRTDWDRRICSVLAPHSKYFHCDETMRSNFFLHQWAINKRGANSVIITTIRGNIYKGLETIYECKKILNKIDLAYKIIWKIAGIKETDEISYLLQRKYRFTFREMGILLLGPLEENELIQEMLNSNIFIHPSHIENGSNSTSEAMLLGMPVIATFAGGIPTTIENKKEGLLVQDGDPYALAGAILELLRDPEYANFLGEHARLKALNRHNPQKITNEVIKIYNLLIDE